MKVGERENLGLLSAIERFPNATQRQLAERLGFSLGKTNQLIRKMVQEGWIEYCAGELPLPGRGEQAGGSDGEGNDHSGASLDRYRLTGQGAREKMRLLKQHLDETVDNYAAVRDRISSHLKALPLQRRRVVFYGAGDVAQIAYIVVACGDFDLVGVVDDHRVGESFFGHRVQSPSRLQDGRLAAREYDTLVVTAHRRAGEILENLRRLEVAPERILIALP